MILSNVRTSSNLIYGQIWSTLYEIGLNNYQILLPKGQTNDFEQCLN